MPGLRDELSEHLLTGWQEVRTIDLLEEKGSPDCEWCAEPRDRRYIHVLKHDDFDRQIRVGSNCVKEATADGSSSGPHENQSDNITGDQVNNGTSGEKPLPVPELLALAGISMVLMGNLALLDPFVSTSPSDLLSRLFTNRSTPQNPSNPSESPGSSRDGGRGDRLSPQIQAQLRTCLKANIERILKVPSLSELATALMGEDEASITETQRQVRALYKTVNELYKLIKECDPSFIQSLLDTEEPQDANEDGKAADSTSSTPDCVTVIAERVNIRAAPSLDSAIIAQALFGTSFQVDQQIAASFSERQRLAMKMGEDWYPVILPDGNRGYIFSGYVTAVNQQRQ